MTNNDQAAATTVSSVKLDWVKPEITAFAAAVEAQGNGGGPTLDGGSGITNLS